MQLSVLLVTDAMLFNSVTLRLGDMDQESFLSQPLYNYFVDGLAAIIPCPKENVFVFNIQVRLFIVYLLLFFVIFLLCFFGCKKEKWGQNPTSKFHLSRIIQTTSRDVHTLPVMSITWWNRAQVYGVVTKTKIENSNRSVDRHTLTFLCFRKCRTFQINQVGKIRF